MPEPQEAIVAAFCSLYPCGTFEHFKFPMIEDLANQSPFTAYMEWREEKDLEGSSPTSIARSQEEGASTVSMSTGQGKGNGGMRRSHHGFQKHWARQRTVTYFYDQITSRRTINGFNMPGWPFNCA